jgi:hypothetical protein
VIGPLTATSSGFFNGKMAVFDGTNFLAFARFFDIK